MTMALDRFTLPHRTGRTKSHFVVDYLIQANRQRFLQVVTIMVELFTPQGNEEQAPAASKKDGLYLRNPLNASNDRPLMQIDRANQWSDYAKIPNAPKVKDQTVLIKGSGE